MAEKYRYFPSCACSYSSPHSSARDRRLIALAATLPGVRPARADASRSPTTRAPRSSWATTRRRWSRTAPVRANWLPDDRFWYRNQTATGSEFVLVDAGARHQGAGVRPRRGGGGADDRDGQDRSTRRACRSRRSRSPPTAQSFSFDSDGKRWTCDVQGKQCAQRRSARRTLPNSVLSPDGKRAAFIRDYNLWVRDIATGTDTQLTTDGVKDFGYATDNAGWTQQRPPGRCCGRPTRRRSPPSSRTSAASARCTW